MGVNDNTTNPNTITDEELDLVVNALSSINSNEMQILKDTVQVDINAELEVDNRIDDEINEFMNDDLSKSELSDKDFDELMELYNLIQTDPNANIYIKLPIGIKTMVDFSIRSNLNTSNIAPEQLIVIKEETARFTLNELINDLKSGNSDSIEGLEKAVKEMLNVPSIADMYAEHTYEGMNTRLTEIANTIKDEDPEKAQSLYKMSDVAERAYTFVDAIRAYNSSGQFKKIVRKATADSARKYLHNIDISLSNSSIEIENSTSATTIPDILCDILINNVEPDSRAAQLCITHDDVYKFSTLISYLSLFKDFNNVFDVSYIYYMIRNLIMLKFSNDKKTEFTINLINNICNVIEEIRESKTVNISNEDRLNLGIANHSN